MIIYYLRFTTMKIPNKKLKASPAKHKKLKKQNKIGKQLIMENPRFLQYSHEQEQHELNQEQAGQQQFSDQMQNSGENNDVQEQQEVEEELDQGNQHEEANGDIDILQQNQRNLEDYQQEVGNKGVVYMSRVPPYMTPNFVRKLLKDYGVQRIYLLPESEWARKNRIKKGGSKRICFREGWIEFEDKRMAKMSALTLNGCKMVPKKRSFYREDVWNLKYLPKFKWHNLTQKLAHEERIKKERLKVQLEQEKKLQEYYSQQIHKSKQIGGIIRKKEKLGKQIKTGNNNKYIQKSAIEEEEN